MSKEYYQQEKDKREYFIAKLTEFQTEFQKYKDSPELKSIYSSVEQEIEQQLIRQRDTVSRIEVSLQTAPVVPATVPTTTAPGDQTPATGVICPDDGRYPPFVQGPLPQYGRDTNGNIRIVTNADGREVNVPNPDIFRMVFGFIEPYQREVSQGNLTAPKNATGCSDYFECVKQHTRVDEDPDKQGYQKLILTKENNGCINSYFDLGKFIEFNGKGVEDVIKPREGINLKYRFMLNSDATNAINTGLLTDPNNNNQIQLNLDETIFQAASQINYLEMIEPASFPSKGIGIYLTDNTQGPACALASLPATLYRNAYLTRSDKDQLDSLKDCPKTREKFYIRNGYVLLRNKDAGDIKGGLSDSNLTNEIIEEIEQNLRVGVLLDTEIALSRKINQGEFEYSRNEQKIKTSFVWASAFVLSSGYYYGKLPYIYKTYPGTKENFEKVCKQELIKTYLLTIAAGIKYGKKNIVLTAVGGGAFGNKMEWITEAIGQALVTYQKYPINVYFLSRKLDKPDIKNLETILQYPVQFNSPISLNQLKKKKKKKDKKREEKLNAFKLNREKREEKLKNMMK